MSNWSLIPTPDLFRNVARCWRLTPLRCTICDAALYARITDETKPPHYHRCAACNENFIDASKPRIFDRAADAMLTEAAKRTDLIAHPTVSPQRTQEGTPQ